MGVPWSDRDRRTWSIQPWLEALEERQAPPVVYVWRECGESGKEAIKRQTVKPGQDVVVLSWEDEAAIPSKIKEKGGRSQQVECAVV